MRLLQYWKRIIAVTFSYSLVVIFFISTFLFFSTIFISACFCCFVFGNVFLRNLMIRGNLTICARNISTDQVFTIWYLSPHFLLSLPLKRYLFLFLSVGRIFCSFCHSERMLHCTQKWSQWTSACVCAWERVSANVSCCIYIYLCNYDLAENTSATIWWELDS